MSHINIRLQRYMPHSHCHTHITHIYTIHISHTPYIHALHARHTRTDATHVTHHVTHTHTTIYTHATQIQMPPHPISQSVSLSHAHTPSLWPGAAQVKWGSWGACKHGPPGGRGRFLTSGFLCPPRYLLLRTFWYFPLNLSPFPFIPFHYFLYSPNEWAYNVCPFTIDLFQSA